MYAWDEDFHEFYIVAQELQKLNRVQIYVIFAGVGVISSW